MYAFFVSKAWPTRNVLCQFRRSNLSRLLVDMSQAFVASNFSVSDVKGVG